MMLKGRVPKSLFKPNDTQIAAIVKGNYAGTAFDFAQQGAVGIDLTEVVITPKSMPNWVGFLNSALIRRSIQTIDLKGNEIGKDTLERMLASIDCPNLAKIIFPNGEEKSPTSQACVKRTAKKRAF